MFDSYSLDSYRFQEALSQSLPADEVYDPRVDILSQALHEPEYPGRVRGLGFGVTQKQYFPHRKRHTQHEFDALNSKVDNMTEKMAWMESQLMSLHQKDKPDNVEQPDVVIRSGNGSCTVASNSFAEVIDFSILASKLVSIYFKYSFI